MTQGNALARYEVLRELGRGAITAVYAARDRSTGTLIALKTLDPALASTPGTGLADRFLHYARLAQRLGHRNIVRIHDAGEADGIVHVAMEMLEGESLRRILDKGPLPVARAIQITHDIACTLAHAHLDGVVHGGLKPSNIIVLRSGAVKVTDFGIAQLNPAPGYVAPEQVRGEPADHRSDIFSLGALLYEMLTRRAPNVADAEPKLPSELNRHVPGALDQIVLRMLARDPEDRLPGAPVLQHDLQQLEAALGLGSGASVPSDEPRASPPAPEIRPQPPSRIAEPEAFDHQQAILMMEREARLQRPSGSRPSVLSAVALILATIAVGLSGFMYYSSTQEERPIVASRTPEAPVTAPSVAPSPPPVAEVPKQSAPVSAAPRPAPRVADDLPAPAPAPAPVPVATTPDATEPAPVAKAEERVTTEPAQKAAAVATPAPERLRQVRAVTENPKPQPGARAQLIVAIKPRGEIYIDGEYYGTTPPITTFDLEPGLHRIEVRSGSRRPFLTYMTVQAGDVRRIRHDFDARARRPPG